MNRFTRRTGATIGNARFFNAFLSAALVFGCAQGVAKSASASKVRNQCSLSCGVGQESCRPTRA